MGIELLPSHRRFNLRLELLSLLPRLPASVSFSALAADLGISVEEVRLYLSTLRNGGYGIRTYRNGRAGIDRVAWNHAASRASAYLERIYGKQKRNPTQESRNDPH